MAVIDEPSHRPANKGYRIKGRFISSSALTKHHLQISGHWPAVPVPAWLTGGRARGDTAIGLLAGARRDRLVCVSRWAMHAARADGLPPVDRVRTRRGPAPDCPGSIGTMHPKRSHPRCILFVSLSAGGHLGTAARCRPVVPSRFARRVPGPGLRL